MKKKRLLYDTFIVIYPFVTVLYLYFASIIIKKIQIGEIHYFSANAFHIPFLLILACFLLFFFIKRNKSHNVSLIIGMAEIVFLQIPQIVRLISFNLYHVLYNQILLSGLIFGTIFTFYIVLLICNIKNI